MYNAASSSLRILDLSPRAGNILFEGKHGIVDLGPQLAQLPVFEQDRLPSLETGNKAGLDAVIIFFCFGVLGVESTCNSSAGGLEGSNQLLGKRRLVLLIHHEGVRSVVVR